MQRTRKMLRDNQWAKIEPLLPGRTDDSGRSGQDNRQFIEALLWMVRTSSPWRDLPAELGNWHATYTRFKRWGQAGVWQKIVVAVNGDRDMESLMSDSTIVRAHQHAAAAAKRGPPSDRTFTRWLNEQITRHGGCAWQSCALVTDR